jgi:hypothetical protein
MRRLSALITALPLMLAGAAGAQTAAPDTPAATPQTPPKLICVRGQAETGSHFGPSKVCHTESEWAMIHAQSNHTMERYDTLENKQLSTGGR